MPNLHLLTSDEIPILIDFEVIKCSNLIRGIIKNLGFSDEVIPLMNVDYCTMKLVLKWASQHKDDPPLPDDYEDINMNINEIPEWDKKFLDMSQVELLDLIRAASFLHIPKLTEYCYKTVAHLITGKTASEMHDIFGVDDVDNEEEVDTDKEEITNNQEFSTASLSNVECLSRKRNFESLEVSETEETSLKKKPQEQQNEN